jgi:myo-inositol-1(or 4)-monophosphatase
MAAIDFKRLQPALAQQIVAQPPFASQRNFGASTLDWCYVAAGRLSLYLHGGQKLWDYAAGSLILAEAGGSMCTLNEDDFDAGDRWQRSVIAALDPGLFTSWKAWIRSHQ